jgi:hypothetical protein
LFGADFTDKQNMKKNRTKIQQTVFSLRLSSAYKRKYLFRNGETRKVWSEEINLNAKTATKHFPFVAIPGNALASGVDKKKCKSSVTLKNPLEYH